MACLAILAAALLACVLPQAAGASAGPEEISRTPSTTKPYFACPYEECLAINEPPAIKTAAGYALPDGMPLVGSGVEGGYTPEELRSAYNIPKTGGKEPEQQTVAVIDAYYDETAESDLAEYRKEYKLGECKKSNGCFKWVNQQGEEVKAGETGKETREDWQLETSLDLDMASAVCPECHILLVEANAKGAANLGPSVDKAVELGATEVSNSYGLPENYEPWCGKTGCAQYSSDYDHPEYENSKHEKYPVVITAAAGDDGYNNDLFGEGVSLPDFPATTPYVIAVGGTELNVVKNVRSSENVWSRSGGGCSVFESTKPTGQQETEEKEGRKGCVSDRTDNDIAADASCETPVSFYDSVAFKGSKHSGWSYECGTSVASPLVAGIEAHANSYTRALGADAFYQKPSMLFHVSEGSNGECGTESELTWYLCHATKEGYNGPTGSGTPDGIPTLGVWSVKATENPSSESNSLSSVSCSSSTACTAVGSYKFGSDTLAERWNGTSWSQQSIPTPEKTDSSLRGVSCIASTNCAAVGLSVNTTGGPAAVTLAEKWNSTKWSVKTTPNPSGALESKLFGISCVTSNMCMSVGEYVSSSGKELPLAEPLNGTEWTVQKPPSPSEVEGSELTEVSCTSTTACTAVGRYFTKTGHSVSLAEHWNGTEWSIQTTPLPEGTVGSYLSGVSCSSSSACTAVGSYETSAAVALTLAERWNGTAWSIQKTPNPTGGKENSLSEVSCSSSGTCTAVGSYENSSGTEVPLTEGWNGVGWLIQEAANPAEAKASSLAGVSCMSPIECSTVGSYDNHSGQATLAETGPE